MQQNELNFPKNTITGEISEVIMESPDYGDSHKRQRTSPEEPKCESSGKFKSYKWNGVPRGEGP